MRAQSSLVLARKQAKALWGRLGQQLLRWQSSAVLLPIQHPASCSSVHLPPPSPLPCPVPGEPGSTTDFSYLLSKDMAYSANWVKSEVLKKYTTNKPLSCQTTSPLKGQNMQLSVDCTDPSFQTAGRRLPVWMGRSKTVLCGEISHFPAPPSGLLLPPFMLLILKPLKPGSCQDGIWQLKCKSESTH